VIQPLPCVHFMKPPLLLRTIALCGLVFSSATSASQAETPAAPPAPTPAPAALPQNVELTSKAWDAFGKNNHAEAIKIADECITAFGASAKALQEQLVKDNATTPVGEVTPEEKKTLESHGPLNDVAACYVIKGLSLLELKKKDDAREAFQAAAKLSHARVWDPQGWFWSPADKASEELEKLK
jgi:tetratricopeptide (TPR) repeat protein